MLCCSSAPQRFWAHAAAGFGWPQPWRHEKPNARAHRLGIATSSRSEAARAADYPYAAPEGAFVLNQGALHHFDDAAVLRGRTAVLSVGSNRAPVQLRRKFGDAAVVPVTPAILHDCDIVHAAILGYYAAVPCTAFPSSGTIVQLNVAWLDNDQLIQMHRTEGIGVAYDFVEMQTVKHQFKLPIVPVYGYAARAGALDCGDGLPAGLAAIPVEGRQVATLTQDQAATKLRQLAKVDDDRTMSQFIAEMQADKAARDAVIDRLRPFAIQPQNPPWQLQSVQIDGVDAYL